MEDNQFSEQLQAHRLPPLRRGLTTTLQVNLGKRCNQACRHCHVGAGPNRTEMMQPATLQRLLWLIEHSPEVHTIDITGGAPELHPQFRHLVSQARAMDRHVMDRCNLTILSEEGQADTAAFLAAHTVEVVASLPCYGPENVDAQRGQGVFERSIAGLRQLNGLGYGSPDSGLEVHLVYNPLGASLPPDQQELEVAYKARLSQDFGIQFNRLYTLTNMPIDRFARDLEKKKSLGAYMSLLTDRFNPDAVNGLMCLNTVSVSWDGQIFDCDFNQMLSMSASGVCTTIWDIESLSQMTGRGVATGDHCLGCTAGAGSSCGGALA